MESQALGSPIVPDRTVASVMGAIVITTTLTLLVIAEMLGLDGGFLCFQFAFCLSCKTCFIVSSFALSSKN